MPLPAVAVGRDSDASDKGDGEGWVEKVSPPLVLPGVMDWAHWVRRVSGREGVIRGEVKGTPWGTVSEVEAQVGKAKAEVSEFVVGGVESGLAVSVAEKFVAIASRVEDLGSAAKRAGDWVRENPMVGLVCGIPLCIGLVGPLRREAVFQVRKLGKTEEQVVNRWKEAAEAALVRAGEAERGLEHARGVSDASLARYALALDGVREDATPLRTAAAEFKASQAEVKRLEAAGERREWRERGDVMELVRKLGEERTRVATRDVRDARLKGIEAILRRAPPVPFVH